MEFADFKPLGLADRDTVAPMLRADNPLASELTFTNLYMWRGHYRPQWALHEGCLLLILHPCDEEPFGVRPVGPGDAAAGVRRLFKALEAAGAEPLLSRVEGGFVERHAAEMGLAATPRRDHFDYVYLAKDLINLAGRRFHRKKNHYNKFVGTIPYNYKPLDIELVEQVLDMQEHWCQMRECGGDPGLVDEDRAIFEALSNFDKLGYAGGAICVENKVEAFSFGEMLSDDTAVIHIEKANPELPGLYAVINRDFAANVWNDATYINREQDLGIEGLRAAKESYRPDHLVEKYDVRPL